jgi:type 2 lantibiotic biosynthesis protein LanM
MTSNAGTPHFDVSLGCLLSPHLAKLATQLGAIPGLTPPECEIIFAAARESLIATLHPKLARLLLLELNAARVEGRLKSETGEARWKEFLDLSAREEFWESLWPHYPTLRPRIDKLVTNRRAAALSFAERWTADRAKLGPLCAGQLGALTAVSFGAGDAHLGGHTVALVTCEGGRVAYKPRPVAVEAALAGFVARLGPLSIRIPAVVDCGDYGWAEFVAHRYAADREELGDFYTGIGQWLAIMRLLAGTDLHQENLIAHGGTPVLIDCETLFTPKIAPFPSGFGDATDHAVRLISGTVFATGLLPGRGQGLGWRGVDVSGVGSLPGQQPSVMLPDIVDAGTDAARIGLRRVDISVSQNHPAAEPSLAEYWPNVLDGFSALSETLRALTAGDLRARLEDFETCRVRTVVRATEVYAELARMLWHPVSLHKEPEAVARARDLLAKQAANRAGAPSDPAVIEAEIGALLIGDIPYFSTVTRDGVLDGPDGTRWLSPRNLVEDAWRDWQGADLAYERNFVRATLVSAYTNDSTPKELSLRPKTVRDGALDERRRYQAAAIMRRIAGTAIRGQDGSVTWLAPTLTTAGWAVQALGADLYGGISGLAILAGAYLREQNAGRADFVEGVDLLLAGLVRTMNGFAAKHESNRQRGLPLRPLPPSGYMGLGGQIWMRLLLSQWGLDNGGGLERAITLAREMPEAAKADDILDVLSGRAGAIPPLLALAHATGDAEFLTLARSMGDGLCDHAHWRDGCALWINSNCPGGMGGFAHGVTGIGWALHRLARATGEDRYRRTAEGAFAFEDSLFDEEEQAWTDLRGLDRLKSAHAWCHGSAGIGLARLDLDPQLASAATRTTLRRAAEATWRSGVGYSHCICHGDMGAWELLDHAIAHGEGPENLTREGLMAMLLSSLEDHGPVCGLLKDAFVPGLFPGIGGIAYQLLRMHPESGLPSLLTLGGSDM